jgi:hypothetical protein
MGRRKKYCTFSHTESNPFDFNMIVGPHRVNNIERESGTLFPVQNQHFLFVPEKRKKDNQKHLDNFAHSLHAVLC